MVETEEYVPITAKIALALRKHRDRTGLSIVGLFKKHKDRLQGIELKDAAQWVDNYGAVVRVKKEQLDRLLAVWAAEPTIKNRKRKQKRVRISSSYLETLQQEITRTGVRPASFGKMMMGRIPFLKEGTVGQWLKKENATAYEQLLEEVLAHYLSLPNAVLKHHYFTIKREEREPISKEDLERLKQYRKVTGILPTHIFKHAKDVPYGLTSTLVSTWLSENTTTAIPEHVQWVFDRCKEVLEEALNI